jgi:CDP-diacylglycerol--glycerol-3-phosphate 3-phosphatidyltransferase
VSIIDGIAAAPRMFFRETAKPLVQRYKREDVSQYTFYERNIANIFTGSRIVFGLIVSVALYVSYDTPWRGFWFFMAGIAMMSDGWDGEVARGLGTVSTLGKALDPIADKLLLLGLSVSLAFNFTREYGYIPKWLFVSMMGTLFFELSVLISGAQVGIMSREIDIDPIGSNSYGKIKFGIQCLAMLLGWTIPNREVACVVATCLLFLAMPFSLLSNRGYRRELRRLKRM